jgi:hypothetical protein
MNEISMAPFAASIRESGALQVSDQLAYLPRHIEWA